MTHSTASFINDRLVIRTLTPVNTTLSAFYFKAQKLIKIYAFFDADGSTTHQVNVGTTFIPPGTSSEELTIITIPETQTAPPHRIIVDVDDAGGGQ